MALASSRTKPAAELRAHRAPNLWSDVRRDWHRWSPRERVVAICLVAGPLLTVPFFFLNP